MAARFLTFSDNVRSPKTPVKKYDFKVQNAYYFNWHLKKLNPNFYKMLVKTGLLIVSNPKHISKLLTDVQKTVKNTLYIQLLSALTDPLGTFHSSVFNTPPNLSGTIFSIYSQATKHCNNLDVKVLLLGLKSNGLQIKTQFPIDVVIFDKKYTQTEIDNFIKKSVLNISNDHDVLTLDCGDEEDTSIKNDNEDNNVYKHVCLGGIILDSVLYSIVHKNMSTNLQYLHAEKAKKFRDLPFTWKHLICNLHLDNHYAASKNSVLGTFDRLHVAHKFLLSDAVLRASEKVTVGVTEEIMTHSKLLWELIEDVDTRINNVKNFVTEVSPKLEYNICKISDPFGPSIVDPTMEALVVSKETIRGGEKINQIRKERNLKELKLIPIPLIDEPNFLPKEEPKVSSSNGRLRLLGSVLKPIEKKNIPDKPYVIGLTGGIASGKSGVTSHLENLDCPTINCDKIAHKLYEQGQPCYQSVIDYFGAEIITSEGEINRRALGGIVFKNPEKLQALNDILWPAIANEVKSIIKNSGKNVVCVDAAVLCQAGWDKFCHEVWATIVPKHEAIKRLKTRNNLTEEQALDRISSQPSNTEYVKNANVIFCPLWEVEYTKLQVHKAWDLLQERLPK